MSRVRQFAGEMHAAGLFAGNHPALADQDGITP
jgi:hypothetical protein